MPIQKNQTSEQESPNQSLLVNVANAPRQSSTLDKRMNTIETITLPIWIITLFLFLASLWQINKGRNKRVTYLMRSGFGLILLYYILYSLFGFFLDDASEFTIEAYGTTMNLLYLIGVTLFCWGFFLMSKDYRSL